MRRKNIQAIIQRSSELGTAAENLLAFLSGLVDGTGQSFDLRKVIHGRDSSVGQVLSRIQTAVGVIAEFGGATRADIVPLQLLTTLETSIAEVTTVMGNLTKQVEQIRKTLGGLQAFNNDSYVAQAKNGQTINLQPHFHGLFDTSEIFLQRFFSAVQILKPRGAFSFQSAATSLSSVIGEASENIRETKAALDRLTTAMAELASKSEQAEAHVEEIKRLRTDVSADRKSIGDYLAEVTQQKATVQKVNDEAVALQADVKAYQVTFDQFQKQLDDREAAFMEGTSHLHDLIEKFDQQRDGVERLIERSAQMLESATVSGLAANFATIMNNITGELRWARIAFYIGILFLALSAIPLLAFVVFPVLLPIFAFYRPDAAVPFLQYAPNSVHDGWEYLGQVLARVTILLPAAWLVSFAAIRHSSLFRLREHYAYKYSMAVAVEGFKQQAPEYDQEIAALILEQLAFNPADKLVPSKEIREGKLPGIAGYLMDKIRNRVERTLPADAS